MDVVGVVGVCVCSYGMCTLEYGVDSCVYVWKAVQHVQYRRVVKSCA